MGERQQLGIRVDKEVADEFREAVEERKGQLRGVLGDELEKAMRHYIHHGTTVTATDELAAIRESVQRLEGAMGTAPADGGTPTDKSASHTHAPSRVEAAAGEKPAANAATEKKIRYLAAQFREQKGGEVRSAREAELIDLVKTEYGFRSDTAERYVNELREWFDLREHPKKNKDILLVAEQHEEVVENIRAAEEGEFDLELEDFENE